MQNALNWIVLQLNNPWVIVGLLGQSLFMMRFVIQWIASERVQKSVVPTLFWYFSLGGGLVVLAYAWHQKDPVFILGQGLGVFIYLRNIYFIRVRSKDLGKKTA